MSPEQKLKLHDRIEVAKTILVNIKDDMKLLAERNPSQRLLYTFLASKSCNEALALNQLQSTVLQAEEELQKEMLKGE